MDRDDCFWSSNVLSVVVYYVVFAFLGAYSTVATTAIARSAPARVTFLVDSLNVGVVNKKGCR